MTKEKEMSDAPSAEVLAHRKSFIAGLRSGRFPQGTGRLHTWDGDVPGNWKHCCLGVACLIAAEDGMEQLFQNDSESGEWLYANDDDTEYGDPIFDNGTTLPMKVAEWYGWHEADPDIPFQDEVNDDPDHGYELTAATVNDDKGWDFAQIADAFETKYVTPYETPEDPSGALEP